MPAARVAGQLASPAGIIRGDRHHPRGRAAEVNCYPPAAPGDVAAA